jgi:aminoglycoside phosphotransferase (APT) family kinase protein
MTDVQFPRRVREITAGWLTDLLTAEGLLSAGRVADLDVDRVSVGTGFNGRVLRLRPAYEPAAVAAVPSFALKIPPGDAGESRARLIPHFEREGRFYQELAAETPLRVPHCFWIAMNLASGDFALMMEDLSRLRLGDEVQSCSPAEVELVVTQLARMQARWWGSAQLAALPWLRPLVDWKWNPERLRNLVESFVDEHRDLMPAHFDRTIERSLAALPGLGEPLPGVPQTLVHGDFRLGNMMFGEPGTADELVVFDWQFTSAGPSRWDLCYFLALNLPVELRRELDEPALRLYHATLTENGVTGYSFDRCYEDYRLGLLLALFQPLGMESFRLSNIEQLKHLSGERRELFKTSALAFAQLTRAWAERSVAAIVDNDAAALLDG